MGHEYFALSYGSWHQEMVMEQKMFEEDRVKGKLRIEGAMFRVVHGTGHYIIGNNESTVHGFRNKSHIAIHLKRNLMYVSGRFMKSGLLRLWGGGLGRVEEERKDLIL